MSVKAKVTESWCGVEIWQLVVLLIKTKWEGSSQYQVRLTERSASAATTTMKVLEKIM